MRRCIEARIAANASCSPGNWTTALPTIVRLDQSISSSMNWARCKWVSKEPCLRKQNARPIIHRFFSRFTSTAISIDCNQAVAWNEKRSVTLN